MKVLTVCQPWASLIVAGIKDVEERSWRTDYRGRLASMRGLTSTMVRSMFTVISSMMIYRSKR